MENDFQTKITNVLVVGSGGAGLRAAIEVCLSGLSVIVLGKRTVNDVHTSLAAGGVNAAFANIDIQDSWQQHYADTYIEGYGIGDPKTIEIMCKEAPFLVNEIDKWGANFEKLDNGMIDQRFFGAHTYRRTCYCGDSTGKSILDALLSKSKSLQIPINDSQYVTEILIQNNRCFGAFSFDIYNGKKTLYLADSVILATGGNTRIWRRSSSRKDENNGDGIRLALKAGCKLTDMEMVQFHPTGMLSPEEIAGTLVTEAVRGEGGRLFNIRGERFMVNYDPERMELSTRDRVALANYTEIMNGRGTSNGGVLLDISHINKDLILKKLPTIYRQFIEYQMLDITKEPMEVAPTAHYSMGGVLVTPEDHQTGVIGLYACGEVAGGLHGANRLGGNSLAEILIFGRRAGISASNYSKQLSTHIRASSVIDVANKKVNHFIKDGKEIGRKLENEIQNLMWNFCGVLRNKDNLERGLQDLNAIKKRFKNLDVRVGYNDYKDLVVAFNLESSIYSAEATIRSAMARLESRGSHQRDDYPEINNFKKFNYHISLQEYDQFRIEEIETLELSEELEHIVNSTNKIKSFKGKLLE